MRRQLVAFFALTYTAMLATWGVMAIFSIRGTSVDPEAPAPSAVAFLLFVAGGASPTLVALLLLWRRERADGLRALWRRTTCFALGRRIYLLIVLLPLVITGVRLVAFAIGGGTFESSSVFDGPASLVAFLIPLFLFGPLTEEFGWRGYALDRALVAGGPIRASLLVGALWAGWHLPLFFIPGTIQQARGEPLGEFMVFALYIAASSFIYTAIHVDAGRALWAAILLHFSLNLNDSVLAELIEAGISDRLVQAFVTAGIAALFVMRWRRADPAIIERYSASGRSEPAPR